MLYIHLFRVTSVTALQARFPKHYQMLACNTICNTLVTKVAFSIKHPPGLIDRRSIQLKIAKLAFPIDPSAVDAGGMP